VRAGRKVNLKEIIETREGSELARRRAVVLMRNLRGELTMEEVARELGLNEAMAYRYRAQLLEGAIEGLEPRPRGRAVLEPTEEARKIEELEGRVRELERALRLSRVREELSQAVPELGRKKKRRSDDGPGDDAEP